MMMRVALLDLPSIVLDGKLFTLALLAVDADHLMLRVQEQRRRIAEAEKSKRLENERRKAGEMMKAQQKMVEVQGQGLDMLITEPQEEEEQEEPEWVIHQRNKEQQLEKGF
jgi:hypothetical protein